MLVEYRVSRIQYLIITLATELAKHFLEALLVIGEWLIGEWQVVNT